MNVPVRHSYRLFARGGAGLACDESGLALGAVELVRVRPDTKGVRRCEVRTPDQIGQILYAAYGLRSDEVALRLHRGLRRAATALESGDISRAGIEAVKLGCPSLTAVALAKLAGMAALEKSNSAWGTEPRVPASQAGGGQWTTDSALSPNAVGSTRDRHAPPPSSPSDRVIDASLFNNDGGVATGEDGRLIPINATTATFDGYATEGDLVRPGDAARLGRAGLLVFGATLLDGLDTRLAQQQIASTVARFGLHPDRSADVTAASAYVWSQYALPWCTKAPFSGAALDAASQAVMRLVLVDPDAFVAMRRDLKSYQLLLQAANGGLADYASESRARPAGVEPALQANSAKARAAIADMLKNGRMQAHHLVAANVWGKNADITRLAVQAGWNVNAKSNLIALPIDEESQREVGGTLPIHNGSHPAYDADTQAIISVLRARFPAPPSPMEAFSILQDAALINRNAILSGVYNPVVKVGA